MTAAESIPFRSAGRMTVAEYQRERTALRETYGDNSVEAAAKRDQTLAALFARSEWTQEELAGQEGKSQSWIGYRLRFGRFLAFTTSVVNPGSLPKNLTEGRFRKFWEQTETDRTGRAGDHERFRAVLALIQQELTIVRSRRPQIGRQIVEQFADGEWHELEDIAEAIKADVDHVRDTLDHMCGNKTYDAFCEKRSNGDYIEYRIVKQNDVRQQTLAEVSKQLRPICNALKKQNTQHGARFSRVEVTVMLTKLERLIKEWSAQAEDQDRRADSSANGKERAKGEDHV